ncbi:MAG: hypothetical protein WDN29_01420 [Methylovirgula sp.]
MVKRLLTYIDGERREIVDRALRKKLIRKDPSDLFLNGPSCADSHLAKRFQNKRVDDAFAKAQIAAGITKIINRRDRFGEVIEVIAPPPLLSSLAAHVCRRGLPRV